MALQVFTTHTAEGTATVGIHDFHLHAAACSNTVASAFSSLHDDRVMAASKASEAVVDAAVASPSA